MLDSAVYRVVFDAVPASIVITDRHGNVVSVNAETERMFGYGREELVGRPVEVLVPARLRERHAAHRARNSAHPWARPMESGSALLGQRKDGGEFPAEVLLSPLGPIRGAGEGLVLSVVRDLTRLRDPAGTLRWEREVTKHLPAMLDARGVGIHVIEGPQESPRFVYLNEAACRLWGYTREELLGFPSALDLLVPVERARLSAALVTGRLRGELERGEAIVLHKNGHPIRVEYESEVVRLGRAIRAVVMAWDVTQEQSVKEGQARISESLDRLGFGVLLAEGDPSGPRPAHVNDAFLRLLGTSVRGFLAKPDALALLTPEDRSRLADWVGGSRDRGDWRATGEVATTGGDGRKLVAEYAALAALETPDMLRLVAIVRDVTDRKLLEERLGEELERNRAVLEAQNHLGIGVLITEWVAGRRRLVYANDAFCAIYGCTREQLKILGEVFEPMVPGDRERMGPRARDAEVGVEQPYTGQVQLVRPDGQHVYAEYAMQAMRQEQGVRALVIMRNVTERHRTQEQERARQQTILREIHHRVKNNLQVVSSLLSLQSRKQPGAAEMLRDTQMRMKSIALLHEKLSSLGDSDAVDLKEYLGDLLRELERTYDAGARGIQVSLDAATTFLRAEAAVPAGMIVGELVSNAVKHAYPSGRGGEIVVELRPVEKGLLMLRVRDQGPGFPVGVDFQRPTTLGLQIVRDLAYQLGGTIEFLGPPGACVTVMIPGGESR